MRLSFDIDCMDRVPLAPQTEKNGKGWSFSNVYYLRNIKDLYLLLCKNSFSSVPLITNYCLTNNIMSENGKAWNNRYILEIINALRNFGLLDKNNKPLQGTLFESEINEPLSQQDKTVFTNIFFTYFRFQEFHKIFGDIHNPLSSRIVYAYMEKSRFFNCFVCADINTLFFIENKHQDMMRFWDVYTKWGTTLNVLNKCSLPALDISSNNEELKNAYLLYYSFPIPRDFSVLDFISQELASGYIYIPELERELLYRYKFSIPDIKNKIIEEVSLRSDEYRLQRTSEIFVDSRTKPLLPIVENTFMSHIIKL